MASKSLSGLYIRRFLLSAFPPFWRYWPLYLSTLAVFSGLWFVWGHVAGLVQSGVLAGGDAPSNALLPPSVAVLFSGVAVAAVALIANSWSQWQTSRIANALQGLQTLRTDREYLANADVVRRTIHYGASSWGAPLSPDLAAMFDDPTPGADYEHPSFREASFFLLNQYEFLAAGVRSGATDLVLVDQTLRGPIKALLTTYSQQIVAMRQASPRAFTNLIWLHRTLSRTMQPYLGPDNIGD